MSFSSRGAIAGGVLICVTGWGGPKTALGQAAATVKRAAAKTPAKTPADGPTKINDALAGTEYADGWTAPDASKWKQPLNAPGCVLSAPASLSWLKVACPKAEMEFSGTVPKDLKDGGVDFQVVVLDATTHSYKFRMMTQASAPAPDFSLVTFDMPTVPILEGKASTSGRVLHVPSGAALNIEAWSTARGIPDQIIPLAAGTGTANAPNDVAVKPDGSYTVTFAAPITPGQTVILRLVTSDGTRLPVKLEAELPLAVTVKPLRLTLNEPVPAGAATVISGQVTMPANPIAPVPATATVPAIGGNYPYIQVTVKSAGTGLRGLAPLVSGSGTANLLPVSDAYGNFSVTLKNMLNGGDEVTVDVLPPPGRRFAESGMLPPEGGYASKTVTAESTATLIQPTLVTSPLTEGTTALAGSAPTPTGGPAVSVAVLRLRQKPASGRDERPAPAVGPEPEICLNADELGSYQVKGKPLPIGDIGELLPMTGSSGSSLVQAVNATTGGYTITLATPLKEDDWISIVQVLPAGTVLQEPQRRRCLSPPQRVTYPFDFHRTNLTFVAGVLISNSSASSASSANFSQASQFYAFDADHAWRLPGYNCIGPIGGGKQWGKAEYGDCRIDAKRTDGWHADGVGVQHVL